MIQNGLLQVTVIKAPPQAAEEDHRIFQALGPVDAEDLHPGALLGGGSRGAKAAALSHPLQVEEKGEKALMPRALKPSGQIREGQKVLPPLLPARHGGKDFQKVQSPVDLPEERGAVGLGREEPEGRDQSQEIGAGIVPLSGGGLQSRVIVSRCFGANLRQLVPVKAPHRGAEGRQKGDVLPGVVDDLKPGEGGGDLRGLKKVAALFGGPGDPLLFQCQSVIGTDRARRAQKDGDILWFQGAGPALAVGHRESRLQQGCDPPGGEAGFQKILVLLVLGEGRVVGKVKDVELGLIALPRREGPAGIEGFGFGVLHLSQPP